MHSARETSLASCLAARDNKLTVLVPVIEYTGTAAAPRSYVCVRIRHTSECVYKCEREEREGSVSLGAVQQRDDSLTSSICLCVFCQTPEMLFEGAALTLFPALRGKLSPWARGARQFWCSGTLQWWLRRAFIPRTHDSLLQTKHRQISDAPRMSQKKKAEFVHMRGLGVAALMRKTHSEVLMSLCLFLYVEWGQ